MDTRRVALAAATAASLLAVAVAGATEGQRTTGAKASGSTSPRAHAPATPAHRADATGVQRKQARAGAGPIYLDTSYSFAERAADLASRMTLSEKASQTISSRSPAIPRLGVQPWGWWNEALHGVSRSQLLDNANATTLTNTTSYPIDQSLGSSWDPDLVYRVAGAIGDEAREVSTDNRLNLDFYSPTMNLERDPRWGRNDEAYGEDPLLVTKLVEQFVNGMEGKDRDGTLLPGAAGFNKTLTTIKHYAANNSEIDRRTASSDMDDRTLREYYTAAFRGIVRDAQPGSVMSSYNRVNGVPAAADPYLIDTLLRQTFGFKGYVTSDCDAIFEIVGNATQGHHWQPPAYDRPVNNTERHAFAMSAGEDGNCQTGYRDNFNYLNQVPTAVDQAIPTLTDTFNVNDLDLAVTRLFTARMALGEFDPPEDVPWVTQARARVPKDSWQNSDANNAVTETPERLALAREAGAKSIVMLKNDGDALPLDVPATGEYKVAVMGFFANPPAANTYLGGYSANQGPAGQAKTVNGFNGIRAAIQAINPDAQVDFKRGFTGSGTTAASLTEVDPAAVASAADYDAVIVYAGTDNGTAREDIDRTEITLPGAQGSLISQVAAQNPNTAVYMETIGPIDVSSWADDVPAILWSSYNGQRKGEALADVLLGRQNPSGRLPSIWYRSVTQIPDISDYRIRPQGSNPGRTHQYFEGDLAYPFGHGLSYTDFDYDNLEVDDATPDADATIDVSVDVTNSGAVAGDDVVQLYATTPDATPAQQRPRKRLQGFTKVSLDPGETKTVTLPLKIAELAFYDQSAHRWVVDPGRFGLQIARSSDDADVEQEKEISVGGTLDAVPAVLNLKPTLAGDGGRDIAVRALFPEDAVIEPNPTVAMKDDTLYGTVRKGQSRPFPAGMKFSYASNRPSVVKVGGDGTLRSVRNGVATVTASVSYGGVTRSADFVVRVVSELGGISVNGKRLGEVQPQSPFRPDDFHYEVVVPDGAPTPTVAATAPNPAAHVHVAQAAGVPGKATIDVTGPDGTVLSYEVAFARAPRSDEFNGALGGQWSWVRHNAAKTSLTTKPGSLTIKADTGDITSTPPSTTNTASNLLLQDAPGDWTIESKLDFSVAPHADNQQGGILAYEDDDNYLRVGWEFSGGQAKIAETIEDSRSGTSYPGFAQGSGARAQVLATVPTAGMLGGGRTLWLRMVKRGARYTTSYSTDGASFTPLYETGASLRNAKVGLFAFNRAGISSDLDVAFDYLRVSDRWPAATLPQPPGGGGGGGAGGGGAPGPGGGPPPTPVPPRDATAPRIRLLSPGRQKLSRLRGRGLAFRIGVDEPAALTVTLRGTARRLSRRLARVQVRRVAAGRAVTVRLRPSKALRKRLKRERRLPALLTVRAVDLAGNATTRTKRLVFRG